jgi:predicted ArsR family transcriptional regulator
VNDDHASRLAVLKALGDDTRYAIYVELAAAAAPMATALIAERLGLHVNTVRPHLERMRDVGLLEVSSAANGGVGRPQHRYALAAHAPWLGLDRPASATLARTLLRLADDVGADGDDAFEAGQVQGREDAQRHAGEAAPGALLAHLETHGFEPRSVGDESSMTVTFAHCPFDDVATVNPSLVCGMHRGMVDGFVAELGGCTVHNFQARADDMTCHVELHLEPLNHPLRSAG